MYLSHAGKHLGITGAGEWWGDKSRAREHFAEDPDEYERIVQEDWASEEFGDRRQELVFIGQGMDPAHTRRALDACLLSEDETRAGLEYWRTLPDPFPDWGLEEAS